MVKVAQTATHESFSDVSGQPPRGPSFGFEITKVIREWVRHPVGPEGLTPGQLLDQHLTEAALRGDEIQEVKFAIESELWFEMAPGLREQAERNKRGY